MPRLIYLIGLSSGVGIAAGCGVSLFLWLLYVATDWHQQEPRLLWGLPAVGLGMVAVYRRYGRQVSKGTRHIVAEISQPRDHIPWHMAPLSLASTVLSHLVGASVGREGTAIQIAASLGDPRWLHPRQSERWQILVASVGAGFAAAIGVPWVGVIFVLELLPASKRSCSIVGLTLVAVGSALLMTGILHAPHSSWPRFQVDVLDWRWIWGSLVLGCLMAGTARLFLWLLHGLQTLAPREPYLRMGAGSALLMILFSVEGTGRFQGLGLGTIESAFQEPSAWSWPLWKLGLTALSLAIGFKGGEFVPLVFIGSTLGSALAPLLGLPVALGAAIGFGGVFGAAARLPWMTAVMALELFGLGVFPYALLAALVAYPLSPSESIYGHLSKKPSGESS